MSQAINFTDITSQSDYILLRDAYRGAGGFRDGRYLVPHHREQEEDWDVRRKNSYFLNYVKPVVDSHYAPIFRKQIQRTGKGGMFELLQGRWDGSRGVNAAMRRAAKFAKRDGVHFLAVTSPATAPNTLADQQKNPPWVYGIFAEAVREVQRDAKGRVVSIAYGFLDGSRQLVRRIDGNGWTTTDDQGRTLDEATMSGTWSQNRETAPVVAIAPGDWDEDERLPTPEFYSVARTNHRIFNMCSERDAILRNCTFPILTYPSKVLKDLTIGTNNALGYDPAFPHEPAWIAPPSDPVEIISAQITGLVSEIYRMAMMSHSVAQKDGGTSGVAQSGVAKSLDRDGQDSALADFSLILQDAETQVWELLSWISGQEMAVSVTYPKEFILADALPELQTIAAALEVGAGPSFAAAARKRMVRVVLPSANEQDLAEIDKDIDDMAQADQADANQDPPPNKDDQSQQEPPANDGA
jgi:hypothetical protein